MRKTDSEDWSRENGKQVGKPRNKAGWGPELQSTGGGGRGEGGGKSGRHQVTMDPLCHAQGIEIYLELM